MDLTCSCTFCSAVSSCLCDVALKPSTSDPLRSYLPIPAIAGCPRWWIFRPDDTLLRRALEIDLSVSPSLQRDDGSDIWIGSTESVGWVCAYCHSGPRLPRNVKRATRIFLGFGRHLISPHVKASHHSTTRCSAAAGDDDGRTACWSSSWAEARA